MQAPFGKLPAKEHLWTPATGTRAFRIREAPLVQYEIPERAMWGIEREDKEINVYRIRKPEIFN